MEVLTIKEALEMTINLLGNISVPRNLNESIGIPIDSAINNLKLCIEAMTSASAKEESDAECVSAPEEEKQDGNDHIE